MHFHARNVSCFRLQTISNTRYQASFSTPHFQLGDVTTLLEEGFTGFLQMLHTTAISQTKKMDSLWNLNLISLDERNLRALRYDS
jgi:hypothetical protein